MNVYAFVRNGAITQLDALGLVVADGHECKDCIAQYLKDRDVNKKTVDQARTQLHAKYKAGIDKIEEQFHEADSDIEELRGMLKAKCKEATGTVRVLCEARADAFAGLAKTEARAARILATVGADAALNIGEALVARTYAAVSKELIRNYKLCLRANERAGCRNKCGRPRDVDEANEAFDLGLQKR